MSITSFKSTLKIISGFPGGSAGKESTCSIEDLGLIPGLRRSPGLPTPVPWPREFQGLYSPWGSQRVGED